ncbi:TonB-dependent receptor [Opitutus sp. ER46]|uniref:TonB-dependent receptor n=1 Tax=Opitutus sp. ER46 TaxID=2161864 RepID=UPI000D30FB9B|nr:TonB-dependent receptor [Opitutus sp. ER46]PTY00336.1 hypothetical protein DB354_01630 [Opitutus sp. ER46]
MITRIGRFPFGKFVSATRRSLASRFLAPLCALLVALAILTPAQAQTAATGVITGRVQNVDTGSYLNNARVRVIGTTREALTNEFGEFRISGVPAGEAKISVFYTGLTATEQTVTVPAGGSATVDVTMTADEANKVVKLSEFVVQSQREMSAAAIAINEQRFAAARKDVVSTDAFGEINQGNIGEFVKFLPGISLDVKDGNTPSGIMVRGFDPNYTNVTMDGGQLASTLVANTQTSSRQFVLEGMNINNISRVEVVKLPTPDMSANVLGGSVNFVTKSAFERVRPELRVSAYLSANEKEIDYENSAGPFNEKTYKVLPSFDIQYVMPVNKRLGFVVTAQHSSQFYLQNKSVMGYRFTGNANPAGTDPTKAVSITAPFVNSFNTSFAPNRSDRSGAGLAVDFKPFDNALIKLNLMATAQKQQTASRGITYNTGNNTPVTWDEHNTLGNASGGSMGMSTSFQERHALTRSMGLIFEFDKNDWRWESGFNYSNANNRTRDMAKGFFRSISVTLPGVARVNLRDFDTSQGKVGTTEVYNAAGTRIDETNLSNWLLTQASNASEPANNVDDVKQIRGSLARNLNIWRIPVTVKLGGDIIDSKRDQEYATIAYTYVGPDGITSNADNSLVGYASQGDKGVSPGFGRVAPEWPDVFKIYQDFQKHPNWWTQTTGQMGDTVKNIAMRSPWFHETITSGYLMADAKMFSSRLRLVGGVRYELTEDEGMGYKQDYNNLYVRDANGKLTTTVRPELGASGSAAYNAALYTKRGYYASRNYSYYHPSAAATFNLTENLLLRAAFAKTIGRPNLSDIVPNLYVQENLNQSQSSPDIGWITGANTGLKPWTAKNYDYSIEYYMPKGGMLMFNVYRKDIRNFFSSISQIADQALLDELGIGHEALGYKYTRRINVADARIQGWEASVSLPLANLAEWGPWLEPVGHSFARHFTLMANATHLDLSGSRITSSDWKRYIPRSRNFGVSWNFPKFTGNVLVNWRGRMLRDSSNWYTGANEYIRARYQVDASAEYQLTKRYSTFFAVRNLLNAQSEWEVSGPGVAYWATKTNIEDYGAQYSLGFRATF